MVITFNELRRIKDKLPSGSSQRIADELGIDVDTVRNYFGGKHYDAKGNVGIRDAGRHHDPRCGDAHSQPTIIRPACQI